MVSRVLVDLHFGAGPNQISDLLTVFAVDLDSLLPFLVLFFSPSLVLGPFFRGGLFISLAKFLLLACHLLFTLLPLLREQLFNELHFLLKLVDFLVDSNLRVCF